MDDQTALEDIRKNGKNAIGCIILYKRYIEDVHQHIEEIYQNKIPKNYIDHVVEEVFVKFFNKKTFRHDCRISILLNRIIKNVVSNYSIKKDIDPDDVSYYHDYDDDDTEEYHHKICIDQIRDRLKREGNTYLENCFEALLLQHKYGETIQEISEKIGRNYNATKTYLSHCSKKLAKYPPLQECRGIFLKICLESVKANLERDGFNDSEIIACLDVCILRLQGMVSQEIASKREAKIRETNYYISDCIEKLIQHSIIPKECREWLNYLK